MLGAKVNKRSFISFNPTLLLQVQQCGRRNMGSETFGAIQGKRKVMRSQALAEGSSWEPERN